MGKQFQYLRMLFPRVSFIAHAIMFIMVIGLAYAAHTISHASAHANDDIFQLHRMKE